ncbi:MAG: SMP-30/gluconolactonase/LRE family protein [Candidatus Obscuribacter sp.]|nr:SMP-30/gluconolactonase/LRE family protein [Candidatus Obscuribacter sp.]
MKTYTAAPVAGAKNFRTTLGEGALWESESELLYFVDIDGQAVHSYDPESGKHHYKKTGNKVSTVVKRAGHKQILIAVGHDLELIAQDLQWEAQRDFALLAKVPLDKSMRFNDGKCDAKGRFWCGTMALAETEGAGELYKMETDHTVSKQLSDVTISNGICWSFDNKTMYYIDTPKGTVDAFDYDLDLGTISNRRVVVNNQWGGQFDGMTIDSQGNLYIALWGDSKVIAINPNNDKDKQLIATIELPEVLNVTSCAFGGNDLKTLFITTATNQTDLKDYPNAGLLHQVSLNIPGLAAHQYRG